MELCASWTPGDIYKLFTKECGKTSVGGKTERERPRAAGTAEF